MSSRGVQQRHQEPPPPPPPGSSSPNHHRSRPSPHQHQRQRHVIVEILSADLTRNFELPGCRMDPYAVVERVECDPISTPDRGVNARKMTSSNGTDQQHNHRHGADGAIMVARTDTHWDAHKHPVWEHTCRPFPYTPRRERLDVSVYEDNRATRAEWCGTASVPLDDVLPRPSEAKNVATSPGGSGDFGPVREIPLIWKKGQVTGTVSVRARLVMRKAGKTRGVHSPGGKATPPQSSSSSSASLTGGDGGGSSDGITRVDPGAFVQPVERLGVSGGTAPFFRLRLVDPEKFNKTVTSPTHYIGKDLSHAADEIAFYEEMLLLIEAARVSLLHRNHRSPSGGGGRKGARNGSGNSGGSGLADRLDAVALSTSLSDDDTKDENALAILLDSYAFEYAGVLVATEAGVQPPDDPTRQLLVLRNLRDGKSTLRLLDLKMGRQTASANWQGKTRGRALRQKLLDGLTNSTTEGYRLEGFDGRPDALSSFDPMLDVPDGLSERNVHMYRKKAGRIMLQSMNGTEIFAHFLDLHRDGVAAAGGGDDDMVSFCYTTEELSELVLHEIVRRLVRLAVLCHKVSVPQKWVGSSVALGYDSGLAANPPPRAESSEREIRSSVLVNVFDWGRSELNTAEKMEDLTPEEIHNREKFWGYYTGGVDRLAWVAAKTYLHRFGNAESWKKVTFTVLDFDSVSKDDFLGQATVPVAATNGIAQCQLEERTTSRHSIFGSVGGKGSKCCNDDGGPTLYYSMEWRPLGIKVASRLEGTWRITIHRAENLPNADSGTAGVSDPYCVVTAVSSSKRDENVGVGRVGGGGNALSFEQVTSVKPNTLSPTWNETLDLPVARRADALRVALEGGGMDMGKNVKRERDLRGLLPQESILPVDTPSLRQTARSVTSTSFDEWSDLLGASPMPDVGLRS